MSFQPKTGVRYPERLHEYLGGTINGFGGFLQGIGGVTDHVHLLVCFKATHCLSGFMRELEKASSHWVHNEIGSKGLAWQEGYDTCSVSPTARDGVKNYIGNQEEHHRKRTFREELMEMLTKSGVEYDPKVFGLIPRSHLCNHSHRRHRQIKYAGRHNSH